MVRVYQHRVSARHTIWNPDTNSNSVGSHFTRKCLAPFKFGKFFKFGLSLHQKQLAPFKFAHDTKQRGL